MSATLCFGVFSWRTWRFGVSLRGLGSASVWLLGFYMFCMCPLFSLHRVQMCFAFSLGSSPLVLFSLWHISSMLTLCSVVSVILLVPVTVFVPVSCPDVAGAVLVGGVVLLFVLDMHFLALCGSCSYGLLLDAALLLTVGSFLLAVELFYLQSTIVGFVLTIGAFLLTLLAFFTYNWIFLLAVGKCI